MAELIVHTFEMVNIQRQPMLLLTFTIAAFDFDFSICNGVLCIVVRKIFEKLSSEVLRFKDLSKSRVRIIEQVLEVAIHNQNPTHDFFGVIRIGFRV